MSRFIHAAAVAAALVGAWPPAARDTRMIHFTPSDQATRRFAAIPVEVPQGVTRLDIGYRYPSKDGSNVIDLGLVEPGPLTIGTRAFRGWSGGSRRRISVGVDEATPGYWPGPVVPGTWHVVFGLYKVASEGVDVELTVDVSRAARAPVSLPPTPSSVPRRTGAAWYAGITHAHTTESDGALSVAELLDKAREEGLDFLVITDHNNLTHRSRLVEHPDLLVISGEEVTTPGGHFGAWGLGGRDDFVDFRMAPGDPTLHEVMQAARGRGALITINHPVAGCLACAWTHDIPAAVEAIEVANGTAAERHGAMIVWDTLLRAGRRVTAVEGRDWHSGGIPLATPVLRVWAPELSQTAILDGIRHGRAVVMATPTLPVPEFSVSIGGVRARPGDTVTGKRGDAVRVQVEGLAPFGRVEVEWRWNGETVASASPDLTGLVRFDRTASTSGYGRVHVVAADGTMLALTNPVYIVVR